MPNPRRRTTVHRTAPLVRPFAPGPRRVGSTWVDDLRDHPPAPTSDADLWVPSDVDRDGPDPGPAPGDPFRLRAAARSDPDPDPSAWNEPSG